MGSLCIRHPPPQKTYTTKQLQPNNNPSSSFHLPKLHITTKSLNTTTAQTLLLFLPTQATLINNQYLIQSQPPNLDHQIQQYLQIYTKTHHIKQGDLTFLELDINNFKYQKVALLCINVWKSGNTNTKEQLQSTLTNTFKTLKQQHIKSLTLTDFDTKFGIPSKIRINILTKIILTNQADFDDITIVCLNSESQDLLIQQIKKQKGSEYGKSQSQSIRSDYY